MDDPKYLNKLLNVMERQFEYDIAKTLGLGPLSEGLVAIIYQYCGKPV